MVFTSKMCEKHLRGDIQSASLLKMSLFQRCFSYILLVKTNYLVSPELEHWLEMSESELINPLYCRQLFECV